ncbi:TatD family hydrolase [Oricola cellulosilytica]|uniref:TatD family deoxyribonuclease n=1 Tax=Oricola cellulosilytica TaxID=1429082 RepID=A0A4R0PD69_9HYPH|nr:TatD family hydrolase [Oricola cellulosilytica]TCD13153.1 TatD family deoxyribonuclease [Oricola cellulosilytica]
MPVLIDSHCHLDFPDFEEERDQIVQRARAAGLVRMVTISTKVQEFSRIQKITAAYDDVYCSIGTHPHHADKELDVSADDLVRIAEGKKVVAIGEAGLDYFYDNAPREAQAEGFRRHIDAARRTGLPLIIHARDADEDVAGILREEVEGKGTFPFVLHCFSSGRALAEVGIALGGYVSFSGILTFKKSEKLRAIARDLPSERILVETDAPYLAPQPYRGKRNEPAMVEHTAATLADVRGVDLREIAQMTTENFYSLFSKVPRHDA